MQTRNQMTFLNITSAVVVVLGVAAMTMAAVIIEQWASRHIDKCLEFPQFPSGLGYTISELDGRPIVCYDQVAEGDSIRSPIRLKCVTASPCK